MTGSLSSKPLRLAHNQGIPEVRVRFGAFLDFSYEIAVGLDDLVARWAQWAAPIATRRETHRESSSVGFNPSE